MIMKGSVSRITAATMAGVMGTLSLPTATAQAALIGTDTVLEQQTAKAQRDKIKAFMAREDVRTRLEALGVDPSEAERRVAGLSDEEARRIAGEIDNMPAGQGAVGAIVGGALVVFIVLLITDILGYTDVFTFVRSQ